MKKSRRAATLLGASTATSERRVSAEEVAIRGLRAKSNLAIEARDLEGVSASLADDFIVVIGDGTFLQRNEYIEAFQHGFEQPLPLVYERVADAVRLSASLPVASEHGHWIGRLPNGEVLFTGAYMAMWRRTEAGWKLRSELFVSLTQAL